MQGVGLFQFIPVCSHEYYSQSEKLRQSHKSYSKTLYTKARDPVNKEQS